jgi:hypothetical protein
VLLLSAIRRSAATARLRVWEVRLRAAATRYWELSDRIEMPVEIAWCVIFLDTFDHSVEVRQNLSVHLRDPAVAGSLGGLDQGQGATAVFTEFGRNSGPVMNTGHVRPC